MKRMRTLLLALLLVLVSLGAVQAVMLPAGFGQATLDHHDQHAYIDSSNTLGIEEVLARKDTLFTPADRNTFPYTNATIWTFATLTSQADNPLPLALLNPFAAHDEVDIFLVSNGKVIRHYLAGDTRAIARGTVLNRFADLHFTLQPHSSLQVVVRYHSTTPVSIKMTLLNEEHYSSYAIRDLTIWGIFIGISAALCIYNIMMAISLRNCAFLFYVLHALMNLYNTLTASGHVYAFLSPLLPLPLLNLSYKLTPSLAIIFMLMFISTFFDLKGKLPRLHRVNLVHAGIFCCLIVSLIPLTLSGNLLLHNRISALLLPVSLLLLIFSAAVIAWKRLFASGYFLVGTVTFLTPMLTYVFYYTGLVDFSPVVTYALPVGMAAEAILFAMALGKKVKQIETARLENAWLVEQSNRFNSTSYMLAGVLHQFKKPLVHLGAETLNLRTTRHKAGIDDLQSEQILERIDDTIADMSALVGNFYNFYSQQTTIDTFSLDSAIEKVLGILDSTLKARGIVVTTASDAGVIRTSEKVITQILLIVLENAIDALQERKTREPVIAISAQTKKQVEITISDNGGGIKNDEVEKIFNLHYSKKQSKGLGIGLALAKNLATDQLGGTLTATNTGHGACFKLQFNESHI